MFGISAYIFSLNIQVTILLYVSFHNHDFSQKTDDWPVIPDFLPGGFFFPPRLILRPLASRQSICPVDTYTRRRPATVWSASSFLDLDQPSPPPLPRCRDRVRFRIYFILFFYRPSPRHIPFRWVSPRRRTSAQTSLPPPSQQQSA